MGLLPAPTKIKNRRFYNRKDFDKIIKTIKQIKNIKSKTNLMYKQIKLNGGKK